MSYSLAFFNVCTCEEYGHVEGPATRSCTRPIKSQLVRLFDFAKAKGIVVVSTRCLQGGKAPPVGPTIPPEMVVVSPGATRAEWGAKLSGCSEVLLERQLPTKNDSARAYDAFHTNYSANELVQSLDVERWVVFGIWLQSCVAETVRGLLQLGKQVTVLSDAILPGGHLPISPEEVLEALRQEGAVIETTDEFLDRFMEEVSCPLAVLATGGV